MKIFTTIFIFVILVQVSYAAGISIDPATGIDAGGSPVKNVAEPINPSDASTKAYVDENLAQIDQIPVNFSNYLTVCDGCLANGLTYAYTVPAGKLLVIEFVSVEVENIADGDSMDVSIYTTFNESHVKHYLGIAEPIERTKIDTFSHPYRVLSKQVKFYADSETPVSLHANRLSRVGEAWVRFSFSGYLTSK